MTPTTIRQLNEADLSSFIAHIGGVYEHSPWVAERAWHARPFEDREALALAMQSVVRDATRNEQLALIRKHPRLGIETQLTDYSLTEQTSAGLLQASTTDRERLVRLNGIYEETFGFPFVIAVRDLSVHAIIDACRARLTNDPDQELEESLRQVLKIAGFRLNEIVVDDP